MGKYYSQHYSATKTQTPNDLWFFKNDAFKQFLQENFEDVEFPTESNARNFSFKIPSLCDFYILLTRIDDTVNDARMNISLVENRVNGVTSGKEFKIISFSSYKASNVLSGCECFITEDSFFMSIGNISQTRALYIGKGSDNRKYAMGIIGFNDGTSSTKESEPIVGLCLDDLSTCFIQPLGLPLVGNYFTETNELELDKIIILDAEKGKIYNDDGTPVTLTKCYAVINNPYWYTTSLYFKNKGLLTRTLSSQLFNLWTPRPFFILDDGVE